MSDLLRPLRARLLPALLSCTALLAGCGGELQEGAAVQSQAEPVRTLTPVPVSQADHEAVVQRLFLAYFGRAADPGGLAYYSGISQRFQLVADTGALYWRYNADEAGVRLVLDQLADSPEARALYPDSVSAVTIMYRNLFNRDPDGGGLAYWSGLLASGALTRAQVPVALLAGAARDDLVIFDRKAEVAAAFTAALDTPERQAAYNGARAVDALRAVLAKVRVDITPAQQAALVEEALDAVMAAHAA